MPELQPRLFTDLPPTREETPVHQLNYPTFAGAENTMWHGRTMNSPLYGWEQDREDSPVHVGTLRAAAERSLGGRAKTEGYSPPTSLPGDEPIPASVYADAGKRTSRSSEDFMELAALGNPRTREHHQFLPFRVRDERMFNTPDMPVSDSYANVAEGKYGYEDTYLAELVQAGVLSEGDGDSVLEGDFDSSDFMPPPLSSSGGLYYRNSVEDYGSTSAVVPSARDLQHWPTEVLQHSTNPAQRRTAEFLIGRGY